MWRTIVPLLLYISSELSCFPCKITNGNTSLSTHGIRRIAKHFDDDIPIAKMANCRRTQTAVKIPIEDSSVFYHPKCVFVQRCAGCCQNELLEECKPINTSMQYFKVQKLRYTEKFDVKFEGYVTVSLEKHEKCYCGCWSKARNCSPKQMFQKDSCKCVCPNKADAVNCIDNNKHWDNEACACICNNRPPCSTGAEFDEESCRCKAKQKRNLNLFEEDRNI